MTRERENIILREALAKIGGHANAWAEQIDNADWITKGSLVISRFQTIEATCKAALEHKEDE